MSGRLNFPPSPLPQWVFQIFTVSVFQIFTVNSFTSILLDKLQNYLVKLPIRNAYGF